MDTQLAGRIAVVTGAGRGIGRAIALALADEGANVAVLDVDATAAEETVQTVKMLRADGMAFGVDVADVDQVEAAVHAVHDRWGRIDILVNNAGIGGSGRPIWQVDVAEWERILTVDLTGVFLCCRAVTPHMLAQSRGCIINLSSVFGMAGAAGSTSYSAAKAGVIGLTKALAREVAAYGINVNAIAPGLIDTTMSRTRGTVESMRSDVPWPRLGQVEDVAGIVVFLASPGGAFITGQVISPNGGYLM